MIKIGDGTSPAGINELYKDNKWAYDLFRKSLSNHWVPTTIPMKDDCLQWNSKDCLSPDEKLLVQRCLGFFAGAESLVGNNLLINIYRCLEDGDLRQYLVRQLAEEAIHNETIVYICSSLNLSKSQVSQAYKNIPAIKAKDDFLMACTNDMSGKVSPKELIENLFMFYVLCEGIFFYSGFAMLLNFRNQNKLPGIGQQIRYSYRDEQLHLEFGITLLNKLKETYSDLWTAEFELQLIEKIKKAVDLEIAYVHDALPKGVLGLNAEMFIQYMHYIGNVRLKDLGIYSYRFPSNTNPFPWLSEIVELDRNTNFFEAQVQNYQIGSIVDDL